MLKRFLILGAVALACGVSARYLTTPRAIADPPPLTVSPPLPDLLPAPASAQKLRWQAAWHAPAPGWVGASFSSDGANLSWVDNRGSVRRVDGATGKTVWQTAPLAGVNRVSIGPRGTVVAYSHLNPARPGFRTLDARYGDRKSVMVPVDGAIWNVVTRGDGRGGEQVWIATGARSLYEMPLRPDVTWPGTPALLPGIADTLDAAGANGAEPILLLGTFGDGGVGVWGADRQARWRQSEPDLRRSYQVHLSQDGTTAVATSGIGPHGEQAQLHAWDARTGRLLWSKHLQGDQARASVSASGERIAVTFRRGKSLTEAQAGAVSAPGRTLALLDRAGGRVFSDMGGSFFAPELICLSPDGTRITVRDRDQIWTFDHRGHRIARLRPVARPGKPAPTVREILPLPDASGLLLVTGDGLMTLYKAI